MLMNMQMSFMRNLHIMCFGVAISGTTVINMLSSNLWKQSIASELFTYFVTNINLNYPVYNIVISFDNKEEFNKQFQKAL